MRQRPPRHALGDDRYRAGSDRRRDEVEAIRLGAGHGEEQAARTDVAAIGGYAADLQAGMPRIDRRLVTEKIGKLHRFMQAAKAAGTHARA